MTDAQIIEKLDDPDQMSALDLTDEATEATQDGEKVECYRLMYGGGQRGDLLYLPAHGRAGIVTGGNAEWTDAESPEDAIRRYNDGKMIP